jgi:hypothetical protein
LNAEELKAVNESNMHRRTPFAHGGVSHSQLSIARHRGGAIVNGERYLYDGATDMLIREDVARWLNKWRVAQKRRKDEIAGAKQRDLFAPGHD